MARSRFFLRVLEQQGATALGGPILDVGAGDAWFARQLAGAAPERTEVTCWDVNYSESDTGDGAGVRLTAQRPTGTFRGVLMLDVIEHVERDVEFVSDIVSDLLEVDGWALVSVPAYQPLFTSHDTALSHFRRYSPSQCRSVLASAGLVPVLQGGLFQSLLMIRGLEALRERVLSPPRSHGVGGWEGGEQITKMLTDWLDLEGRLSIGVATRTSWVMPGLSYWAFCLPSGQ